MPRSGVSKKTKTTFGVRNGPPLALLAEAEAGTEDLPGVYLLLLYDV